MYILCCNMSVTYIVYTCLCLLITLTWCSVQADSKTSAGCVWLDINLLQVKPSRIEFAQDPSPSLSLPDGHCTTLAPTWLEYVYRTAHLVLRWLPTKLAEWIGESLQNELGFYRQSWPEGRLWFGLDPSWAESYPAVSCCRWCLEYLWVCGLGVRPVQGRHVCQMLFVWYAKTSLSLI